MKKMEIIRVVSKIIMKNVVVVMLKSLTLRKLNLCPVLITSSDVCLAKFKGFFLDSDPVFSTSIYHTDNVSLESV